MVKNYCPTHHLYHLGYKCPICENERIGRLLSKYVKKDEPKPEAKDDEQKEASLESIQKLINKFKK